MTIYRIHGHVLPEASINSVVGTFMPRSYSYFKNQRNFKTRLKQKIITFRLLLQIHSFSKKYLYFQVSYQNIIPSLAINFK